MLKRLLSYIILACVTCQLSASPFTSRLLAKKDHTLRISSVSIKAYTDNDWKSVSEFFTGEENNGRRCVIRTDNTKREGCYFVLNFNRLVSVLPKNSTINIYLIRDKSFEQAIYTFTIPGDFSKFSNEIYCGITNDTLDKDKILSWRAELVHDNKMLCQYSSILWQD